MSTRRVPRIPAATVYSREIIGKFEIVKKCERDRIIDFKCGERASSVITAKELYNLYVASGGLYIDEHDIAISSGVLYDIKKFYIKFHKHYAAHGEISRYTYHIDISEDTITDKATDTYYDIPIFVVDDIKIARAILAASDKQIEPDTAIVVTEHIFIGGKKFDRKRVGQIISELTMCKSELNFNGVDFVYGEYTLSVHFVKTLIKNECEEIKEGCTAGDSCTKVLCSHPVAAKTKDNEIPVPEIVKPTKTPKHPVSCVQNCEGFELITHIDGSYTIDIPNFPGIGDIGIICSTDFGGQICAVVRGEKINIKFADVLYGHRFTPEVYMINYGKPLFLVSTCKREERFDALDRIINA